MPPYDTFPIMEGKLVLVVPVIVLTTRSGISEQPASRQGTIEIG
jgi:hypothetical protein